jgi:GAF domain-containing protein
LAERHNVRLLDLLASTARELVDRLEADACTVSRVIGDVLILVTEAAPEGRSLQRGQGFLISDHPRTRNALETGVPVSLTLEDPDLDGAEATALEELGFASFLMLPLELRGGTWGLVEVYRTFPRPFAEDDVRAAQATLARVTARAG